MHDPIETWASAAASDASSVLACFGQGKDNHMRLYTRWLAKDIKNLKEAADVVDIPEQT